MLHTRCCPEKLEKLCISEAEHLSIHLNLQIILVSPVIMGKKNKHSKDKLHKTVAELTSHHTGSNRDLELSVLHRRLKFDSCCLSLNTITGKPVGLCDQDDYCYVFDCDVIVEFLEKHQLHPITGSKVTVKDLIELKFYKNNEDQYHCPVLYKLFNQHSKIVVNKRTGNVYSYEAYQQLNLKPKNFKDLLTDEQFEKDDIVTIQDPDRAEEKWTVSNFYYVKNRLRVEDDSSGSKIRNIEHSDVLKASLEEYRQKADAIAETYTKIVGGEHYKSETKKVKLDKINSANYSDGNLASSVTSTVMPIANSQTAARLDHDQIIYPRVKKKAYLQLVTNMGPLNLELYCDRTPKTCHNFLLLATRGYYDNTCFHRLVKDFIIQGGDPTGTGTGGQSAWGQPFKDECRDELKHSARGALAMANSGPASNKSQFYITLRGNCEHLDGKHTVFGRLVGGEETLKRIEMVEVDKKDRPKKEIKILRVVKYVDPYEDVEKEIEEERKKELQSIKKSKMSKTKDHSDSYNLHNQELKKFRSGIGVYVNLEPLKHNKVTKPPVKTNNDEDDTIEEALQQGEAKMNLSSRLAQVASKQAATKSYGDFSNW